MILFYYFLFWIFQLANHSNEHQKEELPAMEYQIEVLHDANYNQFYLSFQKWYIFFMKNRPFSKWLTDSGTAQSRPIQSRQFSPRQFSPRHFSPTTIQSQTDQSQDISVPKCSVQKFSVPDSSVLKHFSPANSVPN